MATADGRKTEYGKAKELFAHGLLEALEVHRRIPDRADRNTLMTALNNLAEEWGRACDVIDKYEVRTP